MNLGVTPEKSIFGFYSLVEWIQALSRLGLSKIPQCSLQLLGISHSDLSQVFGWRWPFRVLASQSSHGFFAVNDDSCLGNAPILTWEIRNKESCQHMGELIGTQHTAGSDPASSRPGTSERQSRLYCQEPDQSMLHSCCSLTTEFFCVARI